jgi:hypothetical protein
MGLRSALSRESLDGRGIWSGKRPYVETETTKTSDRGHGGEVTASGGGGNRRTFLGTVTGTVVLLAGCSGGGGSTGGVGEQSQRQTQSPTATTSPTETATPTGTGETEQQPPSEREAFDEFVRTLRSLEIDVTDASIFSAGYELNYRTTQTTRDGLVEEVLLVAVEYAHFVSSIADPRVGLFGEILALDGTEFGSFIVLTDWALDWEEGELTDEEYESLVLSTIETS